MRLSTPTQLARGTFNSCSSRTWDSRLSLNLRARDFRLTPQTLDSRLTPYSRLLPRFLIRPRLPTLVPAFDLPRLPTPAHAPNSPRTPNSCPATPPNLPRTLNSRPTRPCALSTPDSRPRSRLTLDSRPAPPLHSPRTSTPARTLPTHPGFPPRPASGLAPDPRLPACESRGDL